MRKFFITVAAALTLAATGCRKSADIKSDARTPNIIVILADDLGFGDVSFYGSKTISTPNIDSLARGGACFTNGYASSSTSTPSRYALLTGMYPWRDDIHILPGDAPLVISPSQETLPKMMRKAGYTTGAIGKWHLGMGNGNVDWNDTIRPGAREVGFDYSCIIAATNDRVPTVFVRDGSVVGLEKDDPIYVNYDENFEGEPTALTNPEMLRMQWAHGHQNSIVNGISRIGYMKGGTAARWVDEDMADYFAGEVKKFLAENRDRPFFLYYGLHEPHVPRAPHSRFAGTTGLGPRGDAIAEADWCVGELMNELRRLDLLDNTLIIFTSDNGPVLNDGYRDQARELAEAAGHLPAGGLRGGKYSLFDGGTHIPLCIYWKGKIEPVVSDALVCQMDLFASLADLVGGEISDTLDSRAMLPTFLGKDLTGRGELVIENQGKLGLRAGDYAYLPPYTGPATNLTGNELGNLGVYGLFDLAADPAQTRNLAETDTLTLHRIQEIFTRETDGFYRPFVEEVTLK
ncbi:MAG: sulfatase-like hydrolase/transferase [Bacteroidales bacterium]|nr:sulfatase-like hydrolase/transferase [Bacteroidales bacterium]